MKYTPHPVFPLRASVVIPTRNRSHAIGRCLDALAAQTMPAGTFEVIVVDDGSTTPLVLDASRWLGRFPLKLIRQENTGPAGARNRGAKEACGEFIVFTDDDCRPMPEWLDAMTAALEGNPGSLVGGSTINELDHDVLAETSQLIVSLVYDHFNHNPSQAYFLASNNLGVRRSDFNDFSGFDPCFRVASEDREFCDRWRMQQRPLVWARKAMVCHSHRQNLGEFASLHFRYGRGAFQYQSRRKQRGSGTMREDLSFHRDLPRAILQGTASYPFRVRTKIMAGLLLWQAANAAGFLYGWANSRYTRRRTSLRATMHHRSADRSSLPTENILSSRNPE